MSDGQICAICLSPLAPADDKVMCPACNAIYHSECWNENGGCAVYGCSCVPEVEKRQAIEIPVSYWGQENKKCPNCGREILAAALRCRHCGAVFDSARPQDVEEFQGRVALSERLPAARRTIVVVFIFSVLTCLAPIGAVWGIIWRPMHREELQTLPAIYNALSKIGIGVAVGQTVALVIFMLLYALISH